jgi:tRNA/tmRNA/rRNA uracil-C5-methylase (TrmA/RlmC/RlmD family)
VYLSCGYAALERDATALVAAGWRLASARAFVFFPGTDALETLAVFERG